MKRLKFLVLLLVVVLTGCQSFNKIVQEPRLSLNSVDIAGISINGVDLIVRVDVENPNGFSIPLPKIDWELFVNSSPFIRGGLKSDKSLGSRKKSTVDLPLSVTYEGLFNSFKSLVETREAAYHIDLEISFPMPIIESKIYKLDFSGVLPLPRLPKLSPGQVRISKIDFSGIELACEVNVENPNAFPVPFPKINWDYGINGVPVVKSSITGAGEIAAGAAGAVLIGVAVAYADVFRAVDSLRSEKEAKTSFFIDSEIPIPSLSGAKNVLEIPGILPMLQKPEISFQGIVRKSVGTTMEFVINWELDNRNSFEFDIQEFNYDFKVNNNVWAQGRMINPPKVRAGGKTQIPLTVTISALSLVRELVDIIARGTAVNYSCTGNMILQGSFPGLEKLELPLNLQGSTRIQ